MSPLSLQYRLNRRLLSGVAMMLVVFGTVVGALLVKNLSRQFDRALEAKARAMIELSRRQPTAIVATDGFVVAGERVDGVVFYSVRPVDRNMIARSTASGGRSPNQARFASTRLPDGRAARQVEIEFVLGDPAGEQAVTVALAEPRSILRWRILETVSILLALCTILLLGMAFLVRITLRRGLEPVVGLRRQIETLDSRQGQRVNLQAPPAELAPILRRINELLERSERPLTRRHTAIH